MTRELTQDIAWGVGIVVLALIATFARKLGYIDHDMATRITMGAIGLMVAWFGNRMPKRFVAGAAARQVQRIGGWSMAISGLIYAALWAFAPRDVAVIGGCGAIIAGMAVTIGSCLSLRRKAGAV